MQYLTQVDDNEGSGIRARLVAHSIPVEHISRTAIFSVETRAPKFIDAEFEKHRMLSSNSSSSRAIPFKKLVEIYLPYDLRAKGKGMQNDEKVNERDAARFVEEMRQFYTVVYDYLSEWGEIIHKQHLSRYVEAWTFQTKIVTGTNWNNFFKLRLSPKAQPEIQALATCMKAAMRYDLSLQYLDSKPVPMWPGQWHLPYVLPEELWSGTISAENQLLVSAARCARTSYVAHDKKPTTVEEDLKLAAKLLADEHMTPFEHQATPMRVSQFALVSGATVMWDAGVTHVDRYGRPWSGNFNSWIQHRQLLQDFNLGD